MTRIRTWALLCGLVYSLTWHCNAQESFLKTFQFEYKHYYQDSWLGENGEIVIGAFCEKDSGWGNTNVLLRLNNHGELIGETDYSDWPYTFTGIKRLPEFGNRLLVCGGGLATRSWLTAFSAQNDLLFDSTYDLTGKEFGWVDEAYYSQSTNDYFSIGSARPHNYRNVGDLGILIQRFKTDGTRILKKIHMDTGNYKLPNWFNYYNPNSKQYVVISRDGDVSRPWLKAVVLDSVGNHISTKLISPSVKLTGFVLRLPNNHSLIFTENTVANIIDTLYAMELSEEGEFVKSHVVYIGGAIPSAFDVAGSVLKDSGYLFAYGEMIRTDKQFNILWRKPIPGVSSMRVGKVYETPDGGILLIGSGRMDTTVYPDRIIVLKLDSTGKLNPVGLREAIIEPEWQLSANPVSKELFIQGKVQRLKFTLIDSQGKRVLEEQGTRIDVSELRPGLYSIVAINEKDGAYCGIRKVVIVHE